MKKDNYKLVGSARSLEQLLKKTRRFFHGNSIVFIKIDDGNWNACNIYDAKGRILSARVVKKSTRYRLETQDAVPGFVK